jgi:GxxExxY protein
MEDSLKHSNLTKEIIGTFFEVHNELGFGFLESVYEKALKIALEQKGLEVKRKVKIPVWFRGADVGKFDADLIVADRVVLELKSV